MRILYLKKLLGKIEILTLNLYGINKESRQTINIFENFRMRR
jgi:hypothetical protein